MTTLADQHNIAQQPMGDLGDDWKGNKADVPAQIESPNAHSERQQTATKNLAHEQVSWTQLENLKKLHEEGFLTITEYKERKSQLIDNLTGTKSRTKATIGEGSSAKIRSEFVPPRPPKFENITQEQATLHTFDPKTGEWTQRSVFVKIEKEHFARGGLRRAYHMQFVKEADSLELGGHNNRFVAKMSMDPDEDREVYITDVEMQAYAAEWAKKFNSFNPPKQVEFIKAALLELVSRNGSPLIGVERFIDGPYHKHNNNYGFVSDDDRNTPQAFSHFTYQASKKTVLICDIQGVGDCYTDPQVHTIDGSGFGKGNLGRKGFEQFLATHRCNAICRYSWFYDALPYLKIFTTHYHQCEA